MNPVLYLPPGYQSRTSGKSGSNGPSPIQLPDLADLIEFLRSRAETEKVWCIGVHAVRLVRGSVPDAKLVCVDTEDELVAHANELGSIRSQAWNWIEPLDLEAPDSSLVVFVRAFERSPDPIATMHTAVMISKVSPFVLICGPDRARVNGLGNDGPPQAPDQCREWTLDEFCRFARDCGIGTNTLYGYTTCTGARSGKEEFVAICGTHVEVASNRNLLNVGAVMHVYNESDIIEATIRHLSAQGVHLHVFDNWSTDKTATIVEMLAEEGHCYFNGRFPKNPTQHFSLQRQLEHVAAFAATSAYDWMIHCDADELRFSPWDGRTLAEAISFVDSLGYSAIDFTILNFVFTNDQPFSWERIDDYRFFDFGRHPAHKVQVKAWKNLGRIVDLASTGGHRATFEGRKIYPIKFLTKHFPLRSVEHARKKLYEERFPRFQKEYSEKSWHRHYDMYRLLRDPKPWRRFEVMNFSLSTFNSEYLVERISGIGIETETGTIPNLNTVLSFLDTLQGQSE